MTEPIEAPLAQAVAFHRRGDLGEAARGYRALLLEDPQHFQALLLLGRLSHEEGRYDEALTLVGRALQIDPGSFEALLQRGLALRALGRIAEAASSYEAALALRPDSATALYNCGNALASLARLEEALQCFDRAVELDPSDAAALNNRGVVLRDLLRDADALASFDAALALRPEYPEALNNRGNALQALGRYTEAIESYERALRERPTYAEALNNRGNALLALDRCTEALENYHQALAIQPGYAEALSNRSTALLALCRPGEALEAAVQALEVHADYPEALGNRGKALQALGRHDEALQFYEEAHRLRPADADGLNNLGNALHALGRYEEALERYEIALRIRPESVEALNNRGNVLQALRRPDEALASYARVLSIEPEDAEAHWNEALARLSVGDYERGWQKYEWRWCVPALGLPTRETRRRPWLGTEDVSGKTVLVHAEQGFGDAIQFVRYAPLVAARGARVVLACAEPLRALFETVQGVESVFVPEQSVPVFDFHVPLMSLPLAFRTTLDDLPSQVPYLHAPEKKAAAWHRRLAEQDSRLRVGLAWSGNPRFAAARLKGCPVERLKPLLSVPGCVFVSLQTGNAAVEAARLARGSSPVFEAGPELAGFDDTAALVAALDLVISIDTAVAHLAGALGKPVWIVLPYAADWRWLIDREDSPWYPTARLYRQPHPGDWASVVDRLATDLARRSKGNG